MPPKKKREINPSAITTRTRSGAKQLIREGSIMKLVDTKKVKKDAILIDTVSTRAHKKFGKYQVSAEKVKDASKSPEKSPIKKKDIKDEVSKSPLKSVVVIEEANKSPIRSIDVTEEASKAPLENEDIIEEENKSLLKNDDVLEEANTSTVSESEISINAAEEMMEAERTLETETTLDTETTQEIVDPLTEEESSVDISLEEPTPVEEKMDINTDEDSQELFQQVQDEEAILSEQLSNLEFEMSTVEVIKTECIMEELMEKEVTYIDNLDSEVIIADDTIPVCYEQEVCLESETEEIKLENFEQNVETIEDSPETIEDNEEVLEETIENIEKTIEADSKAFEADIITIEADVETIESMDEEVGDDKLENDELETTDYENTEIKSEVESIKSENQEEQSDSDEKHKTQRSKKTKAKRRTEKSPKTSPENTVRRSSRIKSISVLKQKSKGHGLVKHREDDSSNSTEEKYQSNDSNTTPSEVARKPVKMKSRWTGSSELEQTTTPKTSPKEELQTAQPSEDDIIKNNEEVQRRLKQFVHLKENLYLTERISCKEAKKMTCDCFLTEDETSNGEYGCGEDCLNRLLMIECGSLCAVGDRCTNKRFQKADFAPVEVFNTVKKGLGIRAAANIPYGEFILEYVGEVLDPDEFENRATEYSKDKNQHYYFMALRADAVIDATQKGNISRFINHSCDPNAETQKWTVNGELRIGFFSKRTILAGEEVTFDYQFQRYGKEAQKCFCEASTCRGWLGEEPEDDDEEDVEEEDDDEEEEEEEEEVEGGEEEKVQLPEGPAPEGEIKESLETQPEVKNEEEQPVLVPVKKEKLPKKKEKKKIVRQRLPRKDIFEDLDLDEEIDTLQTTGLKNQAHTLKLSRLMVRGKEPAQRTKLLRVLRRGELPCRRLFLDYHGLRLIHGWMTDAQHMAKVNKKLESLRLEILQTLATLPIPNKTMLQDSKVLSTVEKWSKKSEEVSPLDSDSNSPQVDSETKPEERKSEEIPKITPTTIKQSNESYNEDMDISPIAFDEKDSNDVKTAENQLSESDYETEIVALGIKLLDEWSGLKEVFRIPKKERIGQMKEHEREADRKYRAGLGLEQDLLEKKHENRYGYTLKRRKKKREYPKGSTKDDYASMVDKYERRKLFAMQYEQQDIERRRKQQEIWRQHEQRCITMGADPKFTAPFDPNQGFQCIWNPQTSQWQNFPLPNNQTVFSQPVPIHFPVSQVNQSLIPPHIANSQMAKQMQTPPPTLNLQSKVIMPPQMQFRPNIPPPIPNMHVMSNPPMFQQTEHLQGYQMQQVQNPLAAQGLSTGLMANMAPLGINVNKPPPLPSLPYQESIKEADDPLQVKFMGPIPPPAKLPPKWKCAKDKYGRPYYYHIRFRKPQWEPPELPPEELEELSESTSGSDTGSLSSESGSEDSDSDDEIDDTRLLLQIKNKFRIMDERKKAGLPNHDVDMLEAGTSKDVNTDDKERSLDDRLVEEFSFLKDESTPQVKKRRVGLVQEILISPRTEEDKLQFKEDVKRYKANKEKLKKQKEMLEQLGRKASKPVVIKSPKPQKKHKISVKAKLKEMTDTDAAKKIKESFRSSMAMVMVSILNPYRKPDCKEARITNTEDFKHLARKLTHFVMLKELKHCQNIEELTVTESVKSKAKEFVRKYMSKFGENYQKPKDEAEFC